MNDSQSVAGEDLLVRAGALGAVRNVLDSVFGELWLLNIHPSDKSSSWGSTRLSPFELVRAQNAH